MLSPTLAFSSTIARRTLARRPMSQLSRMMRYFPPNGIGGLARSLVKGNSRFPRPPADTNATIGAPSPNTPENHLGRRRTLAVHSEAGFESACACAVVYCPAGPQSTTSRVCSVRGGGSFCLDLSRHKWGLGRTQPAQAGEQRVPSFRPLLLRRSCGKSN
jgi:hypothetical protein